MTQDEIIEMAREAGFFVKDNDAYSPSVQEDHELTPFLEAFAKLVAAKEREALAQTQEPVANYCKECLTYHGHHEGCSHYTTPPQRTWVGLTDEEIAQGWKESWVTEQAWQSAVWWAEDKLKERNT
jgi:hypothetical protein